MSKKVEMLRIESMNNAQSNEFMTANIARAEADAEIAELLAPQLTAWKDANTQFDAYLKQSQKALLTEDIKSLDEVQGDDYLAFKGMVRALMNVPDPMLKERIRKVKLCVDTYKIDTDWEYIKEMNFIRQMLDDLQGRLAEDVTALGLGIFVEKLAQSNAAVRQAQQQRDDDAAGQLKGQTAAWRRETEKKYREFVEMLNARSLVFGDADYAAFIDKLNASIAHYRQILAVAAGIRAAKKNKEDAPAGSETGDNGGGSESGSGSGSDSGGGSGSSTTPIPNSGGTGTITPDNSGSGSGDNGSGSGGSDDNGGTHPNEGGDPNPGDNGGGDDPDQ